VRLFNRKAECLLCQRFQRFPDVLACDREDQGDSRNIEEFTDAVVGAPVELVKAAIKCIRLLGQYGHSPLGRR
jgi:hypothetical protein